MNRTVTIDPDRLTNQKDLIIIHPMDYLPAIERIAMPEYRWWDNGRPVRIISRYEGFVEINSIICLN